MSDVCRLNVVFLNCLCAAADSERRNEPEEGGVACSVIVCDIDPKVPGVKDGKVGKFNKALFLDGSQ